MTISTKERIALRTEQLKTGKTKQLIKSINNAGMTLEEFYDRAKTLFDEPTKVPAKRRSPQAAKGSEQEQPTDEDESKGSKSSSRKRKTQTKVTDRTLENDAREGVG